MLQYHPEHCFHWRQKMKWEQKRGLVWNMKILNESIKAEIQYTFEINRAMQGHNSQISFKFGRKMSQFLAS